MDQRQQRLRIPRLEHQAVVLVTLAEGVDEILAPDLVGPEAVRRGVVFQVPGERLEDQGDCGQALLAVIDQTGRPVGVEGIDGGDVHDGSEEVLAHVLALAGVENVVPELAAMPLRPGVSALVDGDAKLRRLPDEVEEEGFRGAHGMLRISGTRPGPTPGYPGPHPTQRSTRLSGDVRASVRSIGVAWRTNRPSLGSSTACAMPGTIDRGHLQLGVLIGTIQRHECQNDDLRLVFREFPILGPESTLAARAAPASRAQGLCEPFHRALLGADGPFDLDHILAVARSVGLDAERLVRAMEDPSLDAPIERNAIPANALSVRGTLASVIGVAKRHCR